jgi:hypothetical protein
MKLSEAMRNGIEVTEPMTGTMIEYDRDGNLHACALGAAFVGRFGVPSEDDTYDPESFYVRMDQAYPELAEMIDADWDVKWTIIAMNDNEHVSRDEIANWVESKGY